MIGSLPADGRTSSPNGAQRADLGHCPGLRVLHTSAGASIMRAVDLMPSSFGRVMRAVRQSYTQRNDESTLTAIFDRYSDYTMITPRSYIENLRFAQQFAGIPGDVVDVAHGEAEWFQDLPRCSDHIDDMFCLIHSKGSPPRRKSTVRPDQNGNRTGHRPHTTIIAKQTRASREPPLHRAAPTMCELKWLVRRHHPSLR